ncbi:MAG: hypothetical protein PHW96_02600 [Candidatus Nanoarchaeia archaeon]|nr:hypothetical protein [Candidatus Nanoarchaeia archaeon]
MKIKASQLNRVIAIALPLTIIALFFLNQTGMSIFNFSSNTKIFSIELSSSNNHIDGNIAIRNQNVLGDACYFEVLVYMHNTGTETINRINFEFLTEGLETLTPKHKVGYTVNLKPGESTKIELSNEDYTNIENVLNYDCRDSLVNFGFMISVPEIKKEIVTEGILDVKNMGYNEIKMLPLGVSNFYVEI